MPEHPGDTQAIPGAESVRKALLRAYDSGTHKADVQIVGSHPTQIDAVRVATDIPAADVIAGRQCSVLFLDPSNQDEAVVIAIQGALPSTPSGATVAASATVVSETAFGQAVSAGSASPYSRGDHTHGTPTDPVIAHEAAADPHTVYGALAQAETWAALQTFDAGIQLGLDQPIQDSLGNQRAVLNSGAAAIEFNYDSYVGGGATVGYAFLNTGALASIPVNGGFLFLLGANPSVDTPILNSGGSVGFGGQMDFDPSVNMSKFIGVHFNPRWLSSQILTTLVGYEALIEGRAGTVTNAKVFYSRTPDWAAIGTMPTDAVAFEAENLGRPSGFGSQLGTAAAFRAEGQRADASTGFAIGLEIEAMLGGANLLGVYQRGAGDHNRFVGKVRIGSDAAPTEDLEVDDKIGWEDGTGFLARLLHANTAARDYTFPDQAGTISLVGHTHAGGGADVKSGKVTGISDGGTSAVTFTTAFTSVPNVILTQADPNSAKNHVLVPTAITVNGFTINVHKDHTGGADTVDVEWLATDIGNP